MRKEELRAFRRTLREFERLIAETYYCSCAGSRVSVAQCHLLLGIQEEQPINITELSESLGLDRSTVSRTAEALASRGLVAREENPQDRRISKLVLTQEGVDTAERIHKENDQYFTRVFSSIPKERRKEVLKGFDLLVQACRRR